jgi:hypothetical protein
MAFRAPAPLKSMDLQCGQCVEKSPTRARIMTVLQSPHRLLQYRRKHAQPGAGAASVVFCSSVSYSVDSSTTAQMVASVVSMSEAMEAAFCKAVRVTLVGSITPASTKSSYCSVEALKP